MLRGGFPPPPPAEDHHLPLVGRVGSILPWKIAPAHRITDGRGHPQLFQHAVKLALDLVQAPQDQGETVVGGHDILGSPKDEAPASTSGRGLTWAERIETSNSARPLCLIVGARALLAPNALLVALIPSSDLSVRAKDLFIAAMDGKSPDHTGIRAGRGKLKQSRLRVEFGLSRSARHRAERFSSGVVAVRETCSFAPKLCLLKPWPPQAPAPKPLR